MRRWVPAALALVVATAGALSLNHAFEASSAWPGHIHSPMVPLALGVLTALGSAVLAVGGRPGWAAAAAALAGACLFVGAASAEAEVVIWNGARMDTMATVPPVPDTANRLAYAAAGAGFAAAAAAAGVAFYLLVIRVVARRRVPTQ